jgi:hypothetical protein
MIGFLIKKTFFDLWDNMFKVVLINVGFIASLMVLFIPLFLPSLLEKSLFLAFGVFCIGLLWCSVYLAAAAFSLRSLSDYRSFGFGDFFRNLKAAFSTGFVLAAFMLLLWFLVTVVIQFYLNIQSIFGLILAAMIFWLMVLGILAFQLFFAVRVRLDGRVLVSIKKCFLIFFDNPLFCVFSFIHNMIILALSVFTALLFPGPAGVLLYLDEALRLRLLKYDWLEANPDGDRRKIPWDVLLLKDREKTGTRSLKSFIFPWK